MYKNIKILKEAFKEPKFYKAHVNYKTTSGDTKSARYSLKAKNKEAATKEVAAKVRKLPNYKSIVYITTLDVVKEAYQFPPEPTVKINVNAADVLFILSASAPTQNCPKHLRKEAVQARDKLKAMKKLGAHDEEEFNNPGFYGRPEYRPLSRY